MHDDVTFEEHRPALLALAYRMLGDLARAEDLVQDAWMRWRSRKSVVASPRAFLLTTTANLCLDELGSARYRREELRSDRLPEPVQLEHTGLAQLELLDRISMAFLVLLQRLTPAERAVFLLHDVFELDHRGIGERLGKSEAACRQLLKRARDHLAAERRVLEASPQEHARLFEAFVGAMATGDEALLGQLLADDVVLVVDPGDAKEYGTLRALGRPIVGAARVVSVIRSFLSQRITGEVKREVRLVNGEPGMVTVLGGRITSATMLAVADGRIAHIFVKYADAGLRHFDA